MVGWWPWLVLLALVCSTYCGIAEGAKEDDQTELAELKQLLSRMQDKLNRTQEEQDSSQEERWKMKEDIDEIRQHNEDKPEKTYALTCTVKTNGTHYRPIPYQIEGKTAEIHRDCQDAFKKGWYDSGIYTIRPDGNSTFNVYCQLDEGWNDVVKVNVPMITLVSPQYGPRAGGTLVLIEGHHLNSPDDPLVRFNNITCPLMNSSNTQITCLAGRVSSAFIDQVLPVCITWQTTDITTCYNDSFFTYLPDPTVSKIFPTETLLTGGTNVTVNGTNLMSVAHPALVITIIYTPSTYRANFTSSCEHISNDQLICDTPNITVPNDVKQAIIEHSIQPVRRQRSPTKTLQILTSIQLDSVKDPNAQDVPFTILADPDVTRLTETLVFRPFWPFNDKKFEIKGSGFGTKAALSGTLVVLIGSGECVRIERWDNLIECTLSSTRPPKGDNDREGEYAIQVLIGRRLRFHAGYMNYQQNIFYYPPGRIGLIVGSVVLILLIVAMSLFKRFLQSPKDTPPRTEENLPLQRKPAAETDNAPSSGYENQQSPSDSPRGRNRSARRLLRALNLI